MQPYGKIAVITGLALFAAFLSFLIYPPAREVGVQALGLHVNVALTLPWFLGALLAALVVVQSDNIIGSHPLAEGMGLAYAATFWPLPCLVALFGLPFVHQQAEPWTYLGAFAYAFLLAAVLSLQYASLTSQMARWVLSVLATGAVYLLYRSVLQLTLSNGLMALTIGVGSGALALSLLRFSPRRVGETWARAGLVALIMGQVAWALTFWGAPGLQIALFLFALDYILTSLLQQQMAGQLSKASSLHYAVVVLVGLGVFWYYGG